MKTRRLTLSALAASLAIFPFVSIAQNAAPPAAEAPAAAEPSPGESPPRPPAPEPGQPLNKAQLEYAISVVQDHIDARENRAETYLSDIRRLDDRIEAGIDKILDMLKGIIDSTDSESRVSFLKIDVMEGLHNTIEYYDRKRRALQEDERQRNPSISRETLSETIKKFDARVEKRVEQIIALAKTMPGYDADLERLKTQDSSSWWGTNRTLYTRNDKYYQNRREGARTQKTHQQIIGELKASIDRHDRIVRDIDETLKRNITPQFREMLSAQADRSASLIETRRAQIEALTTAPAKPGGKGVSSQQARNIEDLIKDMIQDLRRDFFNMFEIYAGLTSERQHIQALNIQLASYKAELGGLTGGSETEKEAETGETAP